MRLDVTGTSNTAILSARGDFLGYDGSVLRDALSDIRANGVMNIVLDLTHATHIDTSAVGVVLREVRTQRALGGDLRIAGIEASARTFSVLTLTRVTDTVACFAGVEEALSSFDIVHGPLSFAA